MIRSVFLGILCGMTLWGYPQNRVLLGKQRAFSHAIPKGNYSGITSMGQGRYAVVSDKSDSDGFYVFKIVLDTVSGEIRSVENEGYRSSEEQNRDGEGIAYVPSLGRLLICGEADNMVYWYDTLGTRLGVAFPQAEEYRNIGHSYGLESLSFNEKTGRVWVANENKNDTVWLSSYHLDGTPTEKIVYILDPPAKKRSKGVHVRGVSEICAMDDGRVLVLEREVYRSGWLFGYAAVCKIYAVSLSESGKRLVVKWDSRLSPFRYDLGNYEGMCIAGRLADGRVVLLLCADSQNRYKGVLKDWFRVIVVPPFG